MKGKRKLIKRISAWVLCLVVVIATMNMPMFTMKVEAATITDTVNGITYIFDDSNYKATVTVGTYSGVVTIPATETYSGQTYQVTGISNIAFKDCTGLSSISLPDGITEIGFRAFSGCSNLTSINIPSGVTSIKDGTFLRCSSLTSVTIPSGVTSIGSSAFDDCNNLTSINIPSGVTSIGGSAFANCSSLTSVTIPSGVTLIKGGTFVYCSSLTSVTIPSGVTSIEFTAFSDCTNLADITIPDTVTNIGDNAFNNCTSLTDVEFKGATPPTLGTSSIPAGVNIKVPVGKKAAYVSAGYPAGDIIDNAPTGGGSGSKGNNNAASTTTVSAHTHTLEWVTVSKPTMHAKGTMELRCKTCGYVAETQRVGNDAVVYETYANRLEEQFRTVKSGENVSLELGNWHSVPGYMMERIIGSNVDVELTYTYKGKDYNIVIPAGKGIDLHIPWYGPLLMESLYGSYSK